MSTITQASAASLSKVVRPGSVMIGKRAAPLFCKITIRDGKLSITGVEGPLLSGNARGSCGQIEMHYKHGTAAYNDKRYGNPATLCRYAEGWDAATFGRFLDIWHLWHLNDMRAGCAHQVGPDWDASARVEVVTYKLTGEARNLMKATLRRAQECAINGVAFEMCPQERALVGLRESWLKDVHTPPDADSPLSGCYEVAKREEKGVGSVYPHEHPRGILCKPCRVCGYRYGTAWKLEPLPDDVVAFLSSLPESTIVPAWV